ncbi:predicted protein, partial [Nematostella vectensis]
ITFIAFFGNAIVIHIVATRAYMKTTFNFLIVNMAIADLLVSVMVMPLQFLYYGQQWISDWIGSVTCKWVNFSGTLSITASIIALVAISLDRYFAIIHPFKHLPIIRNTKLITSFIWIVSALFNVLYLVLFEVNLGRKSGVWECHMNWNTISRDGKEQFEFARTYFMATLILLYIVPLVVIGTLYVLIGRKLWSRKIPGVTTANVKRYAETSKRKVLRMLIIVVVVFALCWLPAHIMHIIIYYHSDIYFQIVQNTPIVESIVFFLCHANSAINPILYVVLNKKFQREFINVMSF